MPSSPQAPPQPLYTPKTAKTSKSLTTHRSLAPLASLTVISARLPPNLTAYKHERHSKLQSSSSVSLPNISLFPPTPTVSHRPRTHDNTSPALPPARSPTLAGSLPSAGSAGFDFVDNQRASPQVDVGYTSGTSLSLTNSPASASLPSSYPSPLPSPPSPSPPPSLISTTSPPSSISTGPRASSPHAPRKIRPEPPSRPLPPPPSTPSAIYRHLTPSEARHLTIIIKHHLLPLRSSTSKALMQGCIALSDKLDEAGVKWDRSRRVMGLHIKGIWEEGWVGGSGSGCGASLGVGWGCMTSRSNLGVDGSGYGSGVEDRWGDGGKMEQYVQGSFLSTAEEPHPLDPTPLPIPLDPSSYSALQLSLYSNTYTKANSSFSSLLSTLPGLPGGSSTSLSLSRCNDMPSRRQKPMSLVLEKLMRSIRADEGDLGWRGRITSWRSPREDLLHSPRAQARPIEVDIQPHVGEDTGEKGAWEAKEDGIEDEQEGEREWFEVMKWGDEQHDVYTGW